MNTMDYIVILVAAACSGFIFQLVKLPPLLGFLVAGFVLHLLGIHQAPVIDTIANLGVTLLLFSIGLKLDVRTLLRREVYGTAFLHLIFNGMLFLAIFSVFKWLSITQLKVLSNEALMLLAFALSFSSTVFAVKVLQDKSELQSLYGRVAIGILVMQDLFAVIYLSASSGKIPSLWALSLLTLIPLRPLLLRLLNRAGHGEVQLLVGFCMAFVVGYAWFDSVHIKPDLGALLIGMLLAGTPQANNLGRDLFAFKELFLVAFFLSIGMHYFPTMESLFIAILITLLVPLKAALYLLLMLVFRLRARTAWMGTLSLANYSEFGLIVSAIAVQSNILDGSWLAILAIALSLSFIISAPLNQKADHIYRRVQNRLCRLQRNRLHLDDLPIELGNMEIVILGMGRIGSGAYELMSQHYPGKVIGIDTDLTKVQSHMEANRVVIQGDATDSDFWEKLVLSKSVKLVLLTMPHHNGNEYAVTQLHRRDYAGEIAAICRFEDDEDALKELGVNHVVNLYEEAGLGFAQHIYDAVNWTDGKR
ncbi:cation:proton antiporter family protein [Celerinatantimonas diazotrophica]|uniref:Transporter (CPA2 family) n=1 Tax=Celerinatantimonas diazotrophica TaxID=412034 RepID=A0A4R1J8V9_9GAMM|nr:cation:proton antiporter family protein [Celerinatantimonas diazotrophica]TCK46505.1 transporter (CPA2 family) [Celerinatantimonas diazotrophica]CAG9296555.1 Glutathione-regulated potassium-efflux system protein KefC [Celerinatantimonas diazotrophica]